MSQLDDIQARITDCKTYNFGMRNADTLAHFDAPFLLALVREQQAKLEVVEGWLLNLDAIEEVDPTRPGKLNASAGGVSSAIRSAIRATSRKP